MTSVYGRERGGTSTEEPRQFADRTWRVVGVMRGAEEKCVDREKNPDDEGIVPAKH